MSVSAPNSGGERVPLLDESAKGKSGVYTDNPGVARDEEAPVVLVEDVDAVAEESTETRSTYEIVRNIVLLATIAGGLALFIKAFIDADDVEVCSIRCLTSPFQL